MRAVGRQNGLPVAEPETSDYVSSLLKPIFKFIKLVSNFEESMAQTVTTFDTQHSGTIHDSQLDYYGKRLATASSDHTIRVWDVSSESPQWLAELRGHEGPVWQVCWAHPKYGSMLASCSYDKRAIVWREERAGDWVTIYKYEDHAGSVNGVAFAPWELGLHLAVVSSDGSVSVHTHMPDNTWSKKQFQAHANGVTSVSWAPASRCSSLSNGPTLQQQSMSVKQIVTGGCDNQVGANHCVTRCRVAPSVRSDVDLSSSLAVICIAFGSVSCGTKRPLRRGFVIIVGSNLHCLRLSLGLIRSEFGVWTKILGNGQRRSN
eukprot:GHVN01071952.1.p1 GENE.GHVN01071952.1~~GHVN01071952.1.p1  ORF type:complete len:318 (-),score=20.74 GHVN01071952.1:668-1621(-)